MGYALVSTAVQLVAEVRPHPTRIRSKISAEVLVAAKRLAASRARRNIKVTLVDHEGKNHEVAVDGRVVAVVLRLSKKVYLEVAASYIYRNAFMMLATPDESRDGSPRAGGFAITAGGGNLLHVRVFTSFAEATASGHPARTPVRPRPKPGTKRRGMRSRTGTA